MSFGRPGNSSVSFAAKPPERGSFPLDHEGECKEYMLAYVKCMKTAKSKSTDCRHLSKDYLGCRMDKGLMERVNWEDLGFTPGETDGSGTPGAQPTAKGKHDGRSFPLENESINKATTGEKQV